MDRYEANQPQRDSVRFPTSTTAGYRPAADWVLDNRALHANRGPKQDALYRPAVGCVLDD
jgi:hypothetical protein